MTTESVRQKMSNTVDRIATRGKTLFKSMTKAQISSNLINNVFRPIGCQLVKFSANKSAKPLKLSVQCRNIDALEKTQERTADGSLAKKLERVLLTEEVIKDEDFSHLCIRTEMDDDSYKTASRSLSRPGMISSNGFCYMFSFITQIVSQLSQFNIYHLLTVTLND